MTVSDYGVHYTIDVTNIIEGKRENDRCSTARTDIGREMIALCGQGPRHKLHESRSDRSHCGCGIACNLSEDPW